MVLIVFVGIGVTIGLATTIPKDASAWAFVLLCLPIFASIAAMVWITSTLDRRRKETIRESLEAKSFHVSLGPDDQQKATYYAPLEHLTSWMGLKYGAPSIDWLATSSDVGVFEHSYITGSGKTTQEHVHTFAAYPVPFFVPKVIQLIRRTRWLSRITRKRTDLFQLQDEEFDRLWIVMGDEAMGTKAFNADVRVLMQDAPKGESWLLGGHYLVLAFNGPMDDANLARFLERGRRVWKEVAWTLSKLQ